MFILGVCVCVCLLNRRECLLEFCVFNYFFHLLGVPSEVDSYHSLFPLEPLLPPNRLQKTSNFNYITSCYKAVNSKDDLPYCLRRIHGTKSKSTARDAYTVLPASSDVCVYVSIMCESVQASGWWTPSAWCWWTCGRRSSTPTLSRCEKFSPPRLSEITVRTCV